jgi:hypothetical protein
MSEKRTSEFVCTSVTIRTWVAGKRGFASVKLEVAGESTWFQYKKGSQENSDLRVLDSRRRLPAGIMLLSSRVVIKAKR